MLTEISQTQKQTVCGSACIRQQWQVAWQIHLDKSRLVVLWHLEGGDHYHSVLQSLGKMPIVAQLCNVTELYKEWFKFTEDVFLY